MPKTAQVERAKPFVMDAKELPISQPRIAPGSTKKEPEAPGWLADAPKGAFFSPILLCKAGIYKNQVSAQQALKRFVEKGFLKHPKRGVYQKIK